MQMLLCAPRLDTHFGGIGQPYVAKGFNSEL